MKRNTIFLLLLLLAHQFTFAQKIIISTRDTGQKIIQSNISITPGKNILTKTKDGAFSATLKANKNYILNVSAPGFISERIFFKLKERQIIYRTIILKSKAEAIDTFIVKVKPFDPFDLVLKPKILTKIPNPSGGIETLIKTNLGVVSTGELGSQYNVRGGNYDENLVYVNGFEIYKPQLITAGEQEGLSFVNLNMIKKINFSAGGFQAKYGDKLSSVLDVKYIEPDTFAAGASASLMGANIYMRDKIGSKFKYSIGARWKSNAYLLSSLDRKGDYRPVFGDFQSLISYRIKPYFKIEWLSNIAYNRYLVIPQDQETSFGNIDLPLKLSIFFAGQEKMEYQTFFNGLKLKFRVGKSTRLDFAASSTYSNEEEIYDVQGAYRLNELSNDLGSEEFGKEIATLGVGYFINHARNQLNVNLFKVQHDGWTKFRLKNKTKAKLLWGLSMTQENINDRIHEWAYNDSSGYNINYNGYRQDSIKLARLITSKNTINSQRYNGYLQYNWTPFYKKPIYFKGGLRSSWWSINKQLLISPRLTISYKPKNKIKDSTLYYPWAGKVSFGYYYQPPFYREMRNLAGNLNQDVQAQKSVHFVVSGSKQFNAWGRTFKYITEAYYKDLSSINPFILENVRIRYYANNRSKGYATGWDHRINGEFIKGLESWFTLSLLSTKENISYTLNGTDTSSGLIRRPTDRNVNMSIMFQDEFPNRRDIKMHMVLFIGTNLPYYLDGQGRYQKDPNSIPYYRRLDMGFTKTFNTSNWRGNWNKVKGASLSLEFFNLINLQNISSYIWIKDVQNRTFGVPTYLTSRRINLKLSVDI